MFSQKLCVVVICLFMLSACSTQQSILATSNQQSDYIKSKKIPIDQLYQIKEPDRSWQQVLAGDDLKPLQTFTNKGSVGSKVEINNQLIETGTYANNPINAVKREMHIHTLGHPHLPYTEFDKWSRWYQENGNTQIFRLFKGEVNTSNNRENAARVEAFIPSQKWLPEQGVVREFGARFTIIDSRGCVKPHYCSIFQAKGNNVDHWSVMLRVDNKGALWFYPRRGVGGQNNNGRTLISADAIGRPFDLKILDDGFNYEMLVDGQSVGKGQWQRTQHIGFRWGIYMGESEVANDVVVLVTGSIMK